MIKIIDYKRGNLNNVLKAFQNFGFDAEIINTPKEVNLENTFGIVLPGVGAFGDAIKTLEDTGFYDEIKKYIANKKPFLGICLGLQLLFSKSYEFGTFRGLDILKGEVRKFETKYINSKVPHMGWNQIEINKESYIFNNISDKTFFYFVHSYYVIPEDNDVILCKTNYGIDFVSGIQKDNIVAFQFHPEKSQTEGLKIIKNFGEHCVNNSSS